MLATALLVAVGSCGGAADSNSSRRHDAEVTAPTAPTPKPPSAIPYSTTDADSDYDDERPPAHAGFDDGPLLRQYGHRAGPGLAHDVAAVVSDYYAAALAGDAARACALLTVSLAQGVAAEATRGAGGGRATCAAKLAPQLAEQHRRIASEEPATMRVKAVYAKGGAALAVLGLRTGPESEIVLAREAGAWRVNALFSSYMP